VCQTCHSVYYDPSSNSVVKVVLVSVVYVCGYVSVFVGMYVSEGGIGFSSVCLWVC